MADDSLLLSRRNALAGAAAFGAAAAFGERAQASSGISAVVNSKSMRQQLSKLLYGGFLEHIGNLINHSLWSEVLDDRKFYYGVTAQAEQAPVDPRAARRFTRKWNAVGSFAAITMDTSAPYVGAHSPVVQLTGSVACGVAQSGLTLMRGKGYVGRIVLAADPGAEIAVTLFWDSDARQRQTVRIPASITWTTVPFRFAPGAETTEGRIEIVGRGSGRFRIGAVSLLPEDNMGGFRPDTIALMREMDSGIIRMPGGNFISAYDWKNTIGDRDKRPPILDPVWNAVQPNDVGVDELLHMCRLIGAEPYWCVNTGFGEPRSGAELVEYVNGAATTPWGAQRAANGHVEPYRVKYWNIGNEMYGHWQFGHMALEQYVIKHNLFADAMRKVDPSIYIVAPGGFVDEMTTGQGIAIAGQPRVEFGSNRDWASGMLSHCWGKFDALATHAYPPENKRFDLATGQLFDVEQPLEEWARQPANRVRTMVDGWEEYKRRFPALASGQVKVFFDEWAYHFKADLKGSLAIALCLHELFRHTDFIAMAGYTMATAWLDHDRARSVISAKGRAFQLYNRHFGVVPVAVRGNAPVPAPRYPIGGDQPRVNAGSDTYPLDVSAALTADRGALIVAVVNPTERAQSLGLELEGFARRGTGRSWKLTGPSLDAENRVAQTPQVAIVEGTFDATARALAIAPISVELYEFRAS
jgi:alpha-N-arabinofuranosidase